MHVLDARRRSSVARRKSNLAIARRKSRRVSAIMDRAGGPEKGRRTTQAILDSVKRPRQTDGGNANNFKILKQMQRR